MDYFQDMEARIPKGRVRTRFAPSPTGYMHVGGMRTALYAYLIARRAGGDFLLRIEDTDQERYVEGAVEIIYSTLREVGLQWDEGPDIGGPVEPYVQTERRETYAKYAQRLVELGGAYRCFCRKEDAQDDVPQKYDGRCSRLSQEEIDAKLQAGEPFVIRQRVPKEGVTSFNDAVFGEIAIENSEIEDGVLLKSDGLPTYNFANVIDDHLMGITHVVRGTEYLTSTPKYNLLYEAFGWEIPQYIHCSPVMRDATHKLSKRSGDPTYNDLIIEGYLSDAVLNYVALLGWSPGGELEKFSLAELEEIFDIERLSKSPAIFDIEKLKYFNSEYIRALSPEDFLKIAEPYIRKSVKNPGYSAALIAPLLQQRCEILSDIPEKVDFFDAPLEYDAELFVHKKSKTDREISKTMLNECKTALATLADWTANEIHSALIALAARLEVKNATLMWPLRIACAGKAVTPGGAVEIGHILGRDETLRRVDAGINKL